MSKQQKADWATAPANAKFFAIDENGRGYWYGAKPDKWEDGPSGGYWEDETTDWHFVFAGEFDATNWAESLEERPEPIAETPSDPIGLGANSVSDFLRVADLFAAGVPNDIFAGLRNTPEYMGIERRHLQTYAGKLELLKQGMAEQRGIEVVIKYRGFDVLSAPLNGGDFVGLDTCTVQYLAAVTSFLDGYIQSLQNDPAK